MNSPDDQRSSSDGDAADPLGPFDRRIADAARSLKRPAPNGLLEQIRARAADPDAALDTAARALVAAAPLSFADVLAKANDAAAADDVDQFTKLDEFDERIAAAARSLRHSALHAAPPGLLDTIRARSRRPTLAIPRPLRAVLALAAALLLAVLLFDHLGRDAAAASNPALLTTAALAAAESAEAALESQANVLTARLAHDAAITGDELVAPLLEEVAFLEQAIAECRAALAISRLHAQLRDQLLELAQRRVALLQQIDAMRATAPTGGARG